MLRSSISVYGTFVKRYGRINSMKKFTTLYILIAITFTNYIFPQEPQEPKEEEKGSFWDRAVQESQKVMDKSSESISSVMESMMQAVDNEIENLKKDDSGRIDAQKKINGIRDYLDEYAELKEKDQTDSCVQGIFKSTVKCRVLIDKVLYEIEGIVFDGQIISYSERIRDIRSEIKNQETKKSELNEDFVFAKDEVDASVFESSKEDLAEDIAKIDTFITKSNTLIESLEYDLQTKMLNLGIDLSIEQVKMLTTRVDGDDLAKSIAIFDVTSQISDSLAKLMKQNSFSGESTRKYYGIYVILSEILGFAQREYINKLDEIYLKNINEIKNNSYKSIAMAKDKINESRLERSIEILNNNIEAERFTIKVADLYRDRLVNQRSKTLTALRNTEELISVGYSSYVVASNASSIASIIQDTQSNFDQIMGMQIPDIIPFENSELEAEFIKLSSKITSL